MAQLRESNLAAEAPANRRTIVGQVECAVAVRPLTTVARVGLAVGAGALFALPMLLLLSAGVSPVAVVTESLAYRYFNSLRILNGEDGLILVVQGHLPGLVHHALIIALDVIGVPQDDLRVRLDAFTYLFLGINATTMLVVLVAAALDRRLSHGDVLTVAIIPIWATYSSQSALSLAIRPDYYVVEGTLTAAVVLLFLRWWRAPLAAITVWGVLWAGVLLGMLAATKISLVWTGAVPALVAVLAGGRFVRMGQRAMLLVAAAAMTATLIVLASYRFEIFVAPAFLHGWREYVATTATEDRFWPSLFFPSSAAANPSADYGYARVILPLWLLAAAVGAASALRDREMGWQRRLVPLAIVALSVWQVVQLVVRPAGTTLFEVGLFAAATGGMALATVGFARVRSVLVPSFISILVVHCLVAGLVNGPIILPLSALRASGETVWAAHEWLRQQGQPVIAFIPDNRHTGGTVEEALMKGMSDHPTWNVTGGQRLLASLAPGLSFQQSLAHVPAGSTIFWIDVIGEQPLTEQNGALTTFVRSVRAADPSNCQEWRIATYPWYQRMLRACRSGS